MTAGSLPVAARLVVGKTAGSLPVAAASGYLHQAAVAYQQLGLEAVGIGRRVVVGFDTALGLGCNCNRS